MEKTMDKLTLWQFLSSFLAESKDPKALFFRVVTTLLIILIFNIFSNPDFLVETAKKFSREAVLEQVGEEREKTFSKLTQERAAIIYAQSKADFVAVTRYLPKYLNSTMEIIAVEGTVNYKSFLREAQLVDKTTKAYQTHILGKSYVIDSNVPEASSHFSTINTQLADIGIKYAYTCPYFDLDSLYTGYIVIGWGEKPKIRGDIELEEYLFNMCTPHARTLGRNI